MKNSVIQLSIVLIAFMAFTFLMSYTRPAPDEPKQYIYVFGGNGKGPQAKFEAEVSAKLAEGWHLQGGIASWGSGSTLQAMVK